MASHRIALRLLSMLFVCLLGCDLWDQKTSPVAPEGTVLTIRANPTSIPLFGASEIMVVATHSSGVPARTGTEIRFTSDFGELDEAVVATNSAGVATTILRGNGLAGTANVRATSGGISATDGTATQVAVSIGTPSLAAAFTAEVGESLTVAFKDTSTGDPTQWEWDFGDGTEPSYRRQPDPVHSYLTSGTYLVTLTVSNPSGQDSASDRVTVPASETELPEAAFTFEVNGRTVAFTDTSTNNPDSWLWDFGDGTRPSYRTHQDPTHTYAADGAYVVRLTVANAAGTDDIGQNVDIGATSPPVASFEFSEGSGRTIHFRDTSTNNPTGWRWDFGDGAASSRQNPSHTYAANGTYTALLTATNAAGESSSSQFVTVRGALVADFDFEIDGLTVRFIDRSSGEPTSWSWDFGEPGSTSNTSTSPDPGHTYAAAGTYAVTLQVQRLESGGTGMETDSVTKFATVQ